MNTHRYSVGQKVQLNQPAYMLRRASGTYQIAQLMPFDGQEFQYRIKNTDENFYRIASEHELTEAAPSVWPR